MCEEEVLDPPLKGSLGQKRQVQRAYQEGPKYFQRLKRK